MCDNLESAQWEPLLDKQNKFSAGVWIGWCTEDSPGHSLAAIRRVQRIGYFIEDCFIQKEPQNENAV